MKKICVIGAGIVGLALAYKLIKRFPRHEILVLEKEKDVGLHQSGRNSGVLHAGIYYKPGSLKARLSVSGIRQMTAFCRERGIKHDICGKLVVATRREELPQLHGLFERGNQNGLKGLLLLDPDGIKKYEPHATGIEAIRVPEEGVVNFKDVCQALKKEILKAGGNIFLGHPVTRLSGQAWGWSVVTGQREIKADYILNCAGLQCDRICRMAGERPGVKIIPFKGNYFKVVPSKKFLIKGLVYQVPDPKYPFLGVHFTKTSWGDVEAGPNAFVALGREAYENLLWNGADLADILLYEGFWKFFIKNARLCLSETGKIASLKRFASGLKKLIPEIERNDIEFCRCGIRAQAVNRQGELVQDFLLVQGPRAIHILNAPSPAATASFSIADEIIRTIEKDIA